MKFTFSPQIFENIKISNFIKICPVGTVLFHEDRWMNGQAGRQTDMIKLTVAFRNFVNAPKKYIMVQ